MHCTCLQPFTEGLHQVLRLITDLNLLATGRPASRITFVALYIFCIESHVLVQGKRSSSMYVEVEVSLARTSASPPSSCLP